MDGWMDSWNRKQNKVCVTLDSELYRRKPVLTYAISGNVVGGFGELDASNALVIPYVYVYATSRPTIYMCCCRILK